MKPIATILLSACFLTGALLFFGGSPLAQEEQSELEALRQQNEQLKQMIEDLRRELEQVKLQTESQALRTISELKEKSEELSSIRRLQESLAAQAQQQLKEKEEYLKTMDMAKAKEELLKAVDTLQHRIGIAEDKKVQAQVEEKLKAAGQAMEHARKALEDADVTQKMEEFLRQFPDSEKAKKILEDYRKAKEKQAESKARLALAMKQYEEALRQTTPKELSALLGDRLIAQIAKQRDISDKAKELESAILSKDDPGLLTQLRLEKVDLCRKLGKTDEAVGELEKVIEENLDEATTNAARWTLIEILQEEGRTEDAVLKLKGLLATSKSPQDRRSILYAMIQMAGEDPEARLRATEEVIKWLEEKVEEAQDEARRKGERAQCAANLKQLVRAMIMWSQDNNDEFPEKLSVLYPGYVDSLAVFTCPSAGGRGISRKEEIDSGTSYILRKPPTGTPPAQEIVLYESPSNHGGEAGNAAFADGHVEWLDAARLSKIGQNDRKVEGAGETLF